MASCHACMTIARRYGVKLGTRFTIGGMMNEVYEITHHEGVVRCNVTNAAGNTSYDLHTVVHLMQG